MRDFLYSEIGNFHGIPNIPHDPATAIRVGRRICEDLLEPLENTFGRLAIRSAYRSKTLNAFGSEQQRAGKTGYNCGANAMNYGRHIWDEPDARGVLGGTVCLIIPRFADLYNAGTAWTELAWWIHDHLPYSEMQFFPKNAAFNLTWSQQPTRRIDSYIPPRGCLTKPEMANHRGHHAGEYAAITAMLKP